MSHERRARSPLTPARGKRSSNITPLDKDGLYRLLCHDPRLVLAFFHSSNMGYLSELGKGWDTFRRDHPEAAVRVIAIAAETGIAEKPKRGRR